MPKLSKTYNLQAAYPEIASEWHPSKNDNLKPNELTPGSKRKIWWRCNKGHEWQAAVYSRTRGSGCPHCYKENIVKGKPIVGSGLLKQWHPTLNSGLNPRALTATYTRKIWWLCQLGHEWQETLKNRRNGEGCPFCKAAVESDGKKQALKPASRRYRAKTPRISILDDDNDQALETYTGVEFRKERRIPYHASVMIENPRQGNMMYALMKNYSPSGMNLETDYSIRRGTRIKVSIKKKLPISLPNSFHSEVRWCNDLTDDDGKMIGYSVGLRFLTR